MNLRLVLASSPSSLEERYGRFRGAASTEPSFGLVTLAAVAQARGAGVEIVEASAENLGVDEAAAEVMRCDPRIVGLTSVTSGIVAAGRLAEKLKTIKPGLLVIVGGCHVSALPEETLREFPSFDLAVIGEGEKTLEDILDAYAAGNHVPVGIAGTAERTGTGIRINPPRPFISDLDQLPLPAWPLLRNFPRAFHPSPARIRRWPCASVVFTRGCPNQCTFCDRSVFGSRCRGYSANRCIEMVKDLKSNHGVKEILVEDDTFVISREKVAEFCERLIAERIDISWSCLGRADRVTLELLRLMKKAGCWHISYGIESGDPEILSVVRKKLELEQVRQAVAWSREAGLYTKGFFIVGFPGESENSLKATNEFAKSLPLDDITVMRLTPFPGSELYRMASELGEFQQDWRKMNTLDTVFVPKGLTRQDLDRAAARMLRDFYLRPTVLLRQFRRVISNPRLFVHMCRAFLSFLRLILKS